MGLALYLARVRSSEVLDALWNIKWHLWIEVVQ